MSGKPVWRVEIGDIDGASMATTSSRPQVPCDTAIQLLKVGLSSMILQFQPQWLAHVHALAMFGLKFRDILGYVCFLFPHITV